ncbi:MAG: FtsX-like permease family protein, partial [Bacteroidota bacterium]
LLKEGKNISNVNSRFKELIQLHAPKNLQLGQNFRLQPLEEIRLYSSNIYLNPEAQGDIQYVYVFSAIALITLLIACFNFINLSTTQSVKRVKEVGMRKVMGARRNHLLIQFLGESLLVCFFAFILAIVLVCLTLPELNKLTAKDLQFFDLFHKNILQIFVGIFLLTGLLGGTYPAFFITKINIITSLKGKISPDIGKRISFRQLLVILQFTASIVLITGALLIFKQLNYLQNRPLGFNTSLMLTVPLFSQNINTVFGGVNEALREQIQAFEEKLLEYPDIQNVTLSSSLPGVGMVSRMVRFEGKDTDDPIFAPTISVDYDFIETYELEIVSGRNFNKESGTDHMNAFIVNEQTVKAFNFGDNDTALGKEITLEGKKGQVIGIVKDFHYTSLRSAIGNLILHVEVPIFNTFTIRLNATNIELTKEKIENIWKEFFPEKTFEYAFLDDTLATTYDNENRLGNIIGIFASLAIFVSCLGSYGLIMYNAKQREKEIGVRKVLGAGFKQVIVLFFKDFTVLYGLSFVVAFPLTFYFSEKWLSDFNYNIGISVDVFVIGGLTTLLIVWFTISFQSIKTALMNPIKCLRDD